jgi:hypothetical protein
MQTTAHKDEVSLRGLLRAVQKLSWEDFQEFINRALALQPPAPKPPRLSRRETTLLLKVNSGPPAEWLRQYKRLIEKRRSHGLSADEQRSLLKLIAKMERYDVKRMEWLAELANLRRLPLRALIKSLGLKTPEYV